MGGGGNTSFPGPSEQEQELQRIQLELLQQDRADTEAFKPLLLSQFGLERTGPADADIRGWQTQLRQAEQSLKDGNLSPEQRQYTESTINSLRGLLAQPIFTKTERQKALDEQYAKIAGAQNEVSLLQAERLKKALSGTLPISEGTMQRKAEQFKLLKEQSARNGNPIFGDTPEEAFATSTSGTQALKSFQDTWKAAEDAERRGDIQTGFGNLGTSAQTSGFNQSNMRPGVPDLGTGRLLPQYTSALQPYQFQRSGQFQANAFNAQNATARQAGVMGLIGNLAGAGAGIGAAALLSSKKYKKRIKEVDDKGDSKALSLLRGTKMYTYNYKDEPDSEVAMHHGPITEYSPKEIVTPDGDHIDVANTIGLLTSSIRSLDREIEKIKSKRKAA